MTSFDGGAIDSDTKRFSIASFLALIAGLVLIVFGFIVPVYYPMSTVTFGRGDFTLIACVGLSLVLAAFGTHGQVKYRGLYVTGSGAVAIILYLMLNPHKVHELRTLELNMSSSMARTGYLVGDFDDNSLRAIVMSSNNSFIYGAFDFAGSTIERYEFEIKEKHVRSFGNCIVINIFEKGGSKRFYIPITYVATLDDAADGNSALRWKDQNIIWWRYNGNNIVSTDGKPLAAKNCTFALPADKIVRFGTIALSDVIGDLLLTKVYAAEEGSSPSQKNETQSNEMLTERESLIQSIKNVNSENPLLQAAAQKKIIESRDKVIPILQEWFSTSPKMENEKLNYLSAISLIANIGQDSAKQLVQPIIASQPELLTDLAVDSSKLVSSAATGLLYSFADISYLGPILRAYKSHDSTESRTNMILIMSGIFDRSDVSQRGTTAEVLKSIAGQEQKPPQILRDWVTAIDKNKDSKYKTGWVFVGSLDDPKEYKWSKQYFINTTNEGIPEVGNLIMAKARVNLREGVIEFVDDKGWVNKGAVGLANPNEKYYVTSTKEVVPGYWWAQVRQSPQ